jgi:hypothetical protein
MSNRNTIPVCNTHTPRVVQFEWYMGTVQVVFEEVLPEVPEHLKGKFAEMPPVFKNIDVSRDDIGRPHEDVCRRTRDHCLWGCARFTIIYYTLAHSIFHRLLKFAFFVLLYVLLSSSSYSEQICYYYVFNTVLIICQRQK